MRNLSLEEALYPNEFGFELAFGLGLPMDRSIGYYTANMVTFNYVTNTDGTQTRVKSKENMPIKYCGEDGFRGFNKSKIDMFGIPGFMCID